MVFDLIGVDSDSLDSINLGVGSLVSDALALTDQHLVHW